jgi:ketosteroid isomerase-like protein
VLFCQLAELFQEFAMMDRGAIEALIGQAYAARKEGDIEGLMSAFHPDAVFELAGSKELLAVAGATQGHQDIRTAMTGFIAAFDFTHRDIISITTDGERAAVHSRLTVKFVPGGRTFSSDLVDLFRFKDGKIIELLEFADTALIKDVISVV